MSNIHTYIYIYIDNLLGLIQQSGRWKSLGRSFHIQNLWLFSFLIIPYDWTYINIYIYIYVWCCLSTSPKPINHEWQCILVVIVNFTWMLLQVFRCTILDILLYHKVTLWGISFSVFPIYKPLIWWWTWYWSVIM